MGVYEARWMSQLMAQARHLHAEVTRLQAVIDAAGLTQQDDGTYHRTGPDLYLIDEDEP